MSSAPSSGVVRARRSIRWRPRTRYGGGPPPAPRTHPSRRLRRDLQRERRDPGERAEQEDAAERKEDDARGAALELRRDPREEERRREEHDREHVVVRP